MCARTRTPVSLKGPGLYPADIPTVAWRYLSLLIVIGTGLFWCSLAPVGRWVTVGGLRLMDQSVRDVYAHNSQLIDTVLNSSFRVLFLNKQGQLRQFE